MEPKKFELEAWYAKAAADFVCVSRVANHHGDAATLSRDKSTGLMNFIDLLRKDTGEAASAVSPVQNSLLDPCGGMILR